MSQLQDSRPTIPDTSSTDAPVSPRTADLAITWHQLHSAITSSPLFQGLIALKKVSDEIRQAREMAAYGRILTAEERRARQRELDIRRMEELKGKRLRAETLLEQKKLHEALTAIRNLEPRPLFQPGESRAVSQPVPTKPLLQPGACRVLNALKAASPSGLTVKELAFLTKKDPAADETPRGSLDSWLSALKRQGLVRKDGPRPKKWFFVKDCES